MERMNPASLDVLKSSPVRGQLEPWDPRTPQGTRYIQTTDTYDELKVLLPPGTATMYEQLLKLETYELSKKNSVSWERILEIRHLKDRMIRKCQKLAKSQFPTAKGTSRGGTFAFQTFVAPPDFRLKEMEKWFREQQKKATPVHRQSSAQGYSSGRELMLPASSSHHRQNSISKNSVQRSITNPETSLSRQKQISSYQNAPPPGRVIQPERITSAPDAAMVYPTVVNQIASPPPLPVLLLSQREDYGLETSGYPILSGESFKDPPEDKQDSADQPPSSGPEGEPVSRGVLQRRPSAIKRNSVTELKTVSWADSQQQLDKHALQYASAAREAQASGKWEEVRNLYLDQIVGLENLHIQVKEGLEHLRSETDHLQRIDETIRKQREALNATFQEFEQKHLMFQEKVQEALSEATDALSRPTNGRKELPPINES